MKVIGTMLLMIGIISMMINQGLNCDITLRNILLCGGIIIGLMLGMFLLTLGVIK